MIKRLFDFVFSFLGFILLSPIFVVIAFLIKLDNRGPVFYKGKRVGHLGKVFYIYKFRSMVVNAEKIGGSNTSDRDPRITKIGIFLRKTKLDELPQLVNVLKGEMSFVGPRPEVEKYVSTYTEIEKNVLTVKPGITDWATLWDNDEGALLAKYDDPDKAYVEIILPRKLKLQCDYVKNNNFLIDLKILWLTLKTLFNRKKTSI